MMKKNQSIPMEIFPISDSQQVVAMGKQNEPIWKMLADRNGIIVANPDEFDLLETIEQSVLSASIESVTGNRDRDRRWIQRSLRKSIRSNPAIRNQLARTVGVSPIVVWFVLPILQTILGKFISLLIDQFAEFVMWESVETIQDRQRSGLRSLASINP